MLPVCLLAFFFFTGQGITHAATHTSVGAIHLQQPSECDWRTYTLTYGVTLHDPESGLVVDLQASNINGSNTVKITHNGYYQGEYYLPKYDDYDRIRIREGSTSELVDACSGIY